MTFFLNYSNGGEKTPNICTKRVPQQFGLLKVSTSKVFLLIHHDAIMMIDSKHKSAEVHSELIRKSRLNLNFDRNPAEMPLHCIPATNSGPYPGIV